MNKSVSPGLDPAVLDGLIHLVKKTYHGQIVLITQNFRVVQVERKENFNPEDLLERNLGLLSESLKIQVLKDRVLGALKGLEFGQIVLVFKKGRLTQIERLQKERFSDLQGMSGDGI
ncbi:MAG: YezD family protein [Deltaproteobacteria bacterium]|nr:YezD family protein [Deltaproteobacteria bacterium]